ncbi:hypothetical protein ABT124_06035 [Streptomyces sp. NPDC001982]|uniref:hypothetical protein n=1 Tax=Streptomyces sp. NPDC001982 TaxID=3154405 RepID=UPI00332F90C4
MPANTCRAYERQGRNFIAWCAEHDRTPLPATAQTLAEYVSLLADLTKAPSTIEQAITAIRTAHRTAGYKGQPETAAALAVLKVHRRDRAAAGKRKRKAPPSPSNRSGPWSMQRTRRLSQACGTGRWSSSASR